MLLNEFPDAEADREGGRRHAVILFGKSHAAKLYVSIMFLMYVVLIGGIVLGSLPMTVLLALFPLPLALGAMIKALKYNNDFAQLVPALGMNVIVVLATDFLMAVGFMLA